MNIIESSLNFDVLSTRNATNRVIWHHSGVTVLQSVDIIHGYHKNTLKYAGIGYHFYIRKSGEIFRGRPEHTIGAHAYGSNMDSIGVCFEGDFNKEPMTSEQINAGKELAAYFNDKYRGIKHVKHSDVCQTSCPGTNFNFNKILSSEPVVEIKKDKTPTEKLQELLHTVVDDDYATVTKSLVDKAKLKLGAKGDLVKFVQERLRAHGYDIVIDGKFGKQTDAIIRRFQKNNGQVVDGWVGARTMGKLL